MKVHNFPHQSTSFIGRTAELDDIAARLADPGCRLLTLVGPGGIGKTRLALQAAAQCTQFEHGVYFVPLAPLNTPYQLAPAIAAALELLFITAEDPRVLILNHLRKKYALLVMDNFEHLLGGTDLLTNLLPAAPALKILVTSRERLNVKEEWVLRVDGLSFPPNGSTIPLESYSAVQLFAQRARQAQANFSLTTNAEAVQTICQQVEGMPLGLELAATWLRAMSCQQIAEHMTGSVNFLTTPLRNVPERHRSLRAVFDQSWNLLSENEQAVLMKLSVFRGGFDLDAADQVAGASLLLLAELVDKSLIRLSASGRYDLHELLRQFAADKLLEADRLTAASQQHFDYFLSLAEGAEAHNFGSEQVAWYDRLETEFDNLRAALAWSLRDEEIEKGLQLGGALGWFFSERAHWNEGLEWLERLLAANPEAPASLRAKAHHTAGALAGILGDRPRVKAHCEEALTVARPTNDRWNIAWALSHLGLYITGDPAQSVALLDESLALFRELDDPMGITHTLVRRSWFALELEDYPYMRLLHKEAESRAQQADDKIIGAWITYSMGLAAFETDHDLRQARAYFQSSLSRFSEARFQIGYNNTLLMLGEVEKVVGNMTGAQKYSIEALLALRKSPTNHRYLFGILIQLASVARVSGQLVRAAILLAVAPESSDLIESATLLDSSFEPDLSAVRAELGEAAFAEAWAVGKAMTREQAIDYALEGVTTLNEPVAEQQTRPTDLLTKRELEILRLVAEGLSNHDIAGRLYFTVSTVKWYLSEIYSKLGVHGRMQAVSRAREVGLL